MERAKECQANRQLCLVHAVEPPVSAYQPSHEDLVVSYENRTTAVIFEKGLRQIHFLEEILLHVISSLGHVSYMLSQTVLRLLCNGDIEIRACATERSLTRG